MSPLQQQQQPTTSYSIHLPPVEEGASHTGSHTFIPQQSGSSPPTEAHRQVASDIHHHSNSSGHVSLPMGMQATSLNQQSSQLHSSQLNSVTTITNSYISAPTSDSINAH